MKRKRNKRETKTEKERARASARNSERHSLSRGKHKKGTMVENGKNTQNKYPSNHALSHERGSERSEQASKCMSAVECANEASRAEQANK